MDSHGQPRLPGRARASTVWERTRRSAGDGDRLVHSGRVALQSLRLRRPKTPSFLTPQVPVGHQQLGLLLLFASIGQLSGWWRSNPVLTGISSGSGTLHGSERLVVLLIFWAT